MKRGAPSVGTVRPSARNGTIRLKEPDLRATEVTRGGKLEIDFDIDGEFENPYDPDEVDVTCEFTTPGGRTLVVPAFHCTPFELGPDGTFRRRFGAEELVRPVGIAYVADRDRLYVVDGGAHCIVVFDLEGTVVTRLGQNGTGPGQFNYPSHI